MPLEHPFDKFNKEQDYHTRLASKADLSWEESKVTYLLKLFKFNVRVTSKTLREHVEQDMGAGALTFKAFNAEYPGFPALLGTSRLNGVQLHLEASAMLPALFSKFGATPFMQAYDTFYEKNLVRADGRVVCMLFPRKGFKHGLAVYASSDPQILPLCEREAFFTYVGGKKKEQHWIIVRSFQKVLEAIYNGGHGWSPNR